MEQQSSAQKTTHSSPRKGGFKPGSWQGERVFSAVKMCEHCGLEFHPFWGSDGRPMREHLWIKQRFCSISCSKKQENPMWVPGAVQKMTKTLKEIGHAPVDRWGNGRGLTAPQEALLNALGEGWVPEHAVATGLRPTGDYPTAFKIDIANPAEMIAIEVDGSSHSGKRLTEDRKKDEFLNQSGWSVYRIKNTEAIRLSTIYRSAGTLRSLLAEFSYITAI